MLIALFNLLLVQMYKIMTYINKIKKFRLNNKNNYNKIILNKQKITNINILNIKSNNLIIMHNQFI